MKSAPLLVAKLMPLLICATLPLTAYAQNDAMSNVLQKLISRIEKLQSSCSEDLKQFCSPVTPGGGRLVYCLEAYEDKISAKCAFELEEVELDLQATTEGLKEAVRSCEGDIRKLCGSTQPGEGRIAACLAANRSSVSAGCVDAVEKLNIK
jgi:cysteine rich repeat protein